MEHVENIQLGLQLIVMFGLWKKKISKKVIEHILHITYEDNNTNIGKLSIFSIASHDQKN